MSRHAILHFGPDQALFGAFPRALSAATGGRRRVEDGSLADAA